MITVRNHAKVRLEAGELALGVGLRQARTVGIIDGAGGRSGETSPDVLHTASPHLNRNANSGCCR
jgi:hypothetical protein